MSDNEREQIRKELAENRSRPVASENLHYRCRRYAAWSRANFDYSLASLQVKRYITGRGDEIKLNFVGV